MTSIDKSCETDLDCKISGTDCTLCGCSSTDAVNKNYKPTCIIPDLNRLFVMCSTCRSYLTKCENKQCVIIQ